MNLSSSNPRLIPAIVMALAAISATAHAQTDLTLTVRDQGEGKETLHWGFHPAATSGIDRKLDESEYPPTPPEFLFEARWNDPSGEKGLGQGTKADFRSTGNSRDTFLLRVQTAVENYPVTIAWPKLDDIKGSAQIRFTDNNGKTTSLDMKSETSFTVMHDEPVSKIIIVVAEEGNSPKTPDVRGKGR